MNKLLHKCLSCDKMFSAVLEMLFSKVNLQEINGLEMSETIHAEGCTKVDVLYTIVKGLSLGFVWFVFNASVTRSRMAKPFNLLVQRTDCAWPRIRSLFLKVASYTSDSLQIYRETKPVTDFESRHGKFINQNNKWFIRLLSIN